MIASPNPAARLTAALAVAIGLALVPATAHADRYVVDFCRPWDGPGGGVAFADVAGHIVNTCGSGGSLAFQSPTSSMGNAEVRNITLAIPADRPNIQIERVQTVYTGAASTGGGQGFLHMFDMFGLRIDSALSGEVRNLDLSLSPGDRTLLWGVVCTASPCTFAGQYVIEVSKARLHLNESVAPGVNAAASTLAAGGRTVSFDAKDADSGIAAATVTLGSTAIGAISYPCDTADWSPCRRDRAGQVVTVDTAQVPDGAHELRLVVRDRANNATTRDLGVVGVQGGRLVGSSNGANAAQLAKITARYKSTTARTRSLSYRAQPQITGTLVNERGAPVTGATVAVLARRQQAGATDAQVATLTTGADGSFAYRLARGPSRTVTFAYSAFTGQAQPTTASVLRTRVRALVAAQIRPHTTRAGASITLSGRLRLLARKGIEIKIQARDGRRWRTIDEVDTTKGGRFRWTYRFKAGAAGKSFAFRARVASRSYPFTAGNSKQLVVRVR